MDLNVAIRIFDVDRHGVNKTSQQRAFAVMSIADLVITPNGKNAF